MVDYKKQGKRNRAMGADFERRTRADLESKGWIVSKFMNNIDLEQDKCIPSKPSRFQLHGTGFPDFICYKIETITGPKYKIIFVECKVNGQLSKIEKEKSQWYLKNNYCSKFLIAYKTKEKNKVKVNYKEM